MSDFEAFILAGGASSRMGENKAHLKIGGKTFVELAADALAEIEPNRIIFIGNDINAGSEQNFEVLPDVFKSEKRASIIGLHAALFYAEIEWIAVLACDLPFVNGRLFQRLTTFVEDDFEAVVPLQIDERAQPLCALYRKSCLPKVEAALKSGEWSLQKLLQKLSVRFVRFEEISDLPNAENFFLNINTPKDFQIAQQISRTL